MFGLTPLGTRPGIFQHGGFGNPHVLAILTLVVLGIALIAAGGRARLGLPSRIGLRSGC